MVGIFTGRRAHIILLVAPQDTNYVLVMDDEFETGLMTLNNAGHPITNKLYCRNQIFRTEADGHAG